MYQVPPAFPIGFQLTLNRATCLGVHSSTVIYFRLYHLYHWDAATPTAQQAFQIITSIRTVCCFHFKYRIVYLLRACLSHHVHLFWNHINCHSPLHVPDPGFSNECVSHIHYVAPQAIISFMSFCSEALPPIPPGLFVLVETPLNNNKGSIPRGLTSHQSLRPDNPITPINLDGHD